MTKQKFDKANDINLKLSQSKQRIKSFKSLLTRDRAREGANFKIYYLHEDGGQCIISDHDWDYEDILKALIKHESETIEKLEKEFEEL